MKLKPLFLSWAVLCSLFTAVNAAPIGTTITYSGSLVDEGVPGTATYDLKFTLYNAAVGPSQIGSTVQVDDLGIAKGLFTVELDFGPGIFDGTAYWLEVQVKRNNQVNFTTLNPRQPIYPTPYALWATNAGLAAVATVANTVAADSVSGSGIQANAVTANKIAGGEVVKSLNTLKDDVTLSAGANITLTPVGNDIQIAATGSGNDWHLSGNAGTTPGTDFIGTTDNQPLELKVNNARALRLQPTASGAPSVIGGAAENYIHPLTLGATIAGGGAPDSYSVGSSNIVESNFATIGGGRANAILADSVYATIGGGFKNVIWGDESCNTTIGGGDQNTIQYFSCYATIGGGRLNKIQDFTVNSTIGGGGFNTIQDHAFSSTIGGGELNTIQADANVSTIGGGHQNRIQADANLSTIGGGYNNTIQTYAFQATIGGGYNNTIQTNAYSATIAGGGGNMIQTNAYSTTIAGGGGNMIQANAQDATIGGGLYNTIKTDADGATIAGGVRNTNGSIAATVSGGTSNTISITSPASTISGGRDNSILSNSPAATISGGADNAVDKDADYATIAGGRLNTIGAFAVDATIGGGRENVIEAIGTIGTIAGGRANRITASGYATIGGGYSNTNDGQYATVPGGRQNFADGNYSFAAGHNAKALHDGAFVWGDDSSTFATVVSTNDNSVTFRAEGGYRLFSSVDTTSPAPGVYLAPGASSWTTTSDRNAKKNFAPVNAVEVLDKLAAMPVQKWNYKWEADETVPHIGPMAQDFKHAFYPGREDKGITTQEMDGVALAAIQGLNQKLEEQKTENAELKRELGELKLLVNSLAGKLTGGVK